MNNKQITVNFSLKTALWAIATVVLFWLLVTLREVFILLLLSFIFTSAIDPIVDRLEKKVPRKVAIAGIYFLVILFFIVIIRNVVPPAVSQISALSENRVLYIEKITSVFRAINPNLTENLKGTLISFIDSVGLQWGSTFWNGAVSVFTGVVDFIVVLVASFYLLQEKDGTEKWISSIVVEKYRAKTLSIAKKITNKMSAWLRGQLLLGIAIFFLDFFALTVLRVPFALTLAMIAGFLELLPVIGPVFAATLAVLVAFTVSPLLGLIVAVFYFLIQQLENHILVPQIMKKTLGLHPVVIIFALLAGGKLLGILGIIIAVPVTAAITVIFKELYLVKVGGK